MPRIPFAPDFTAFADAGRKLSELHLGYETCAKFPLECTFSGIGEPQSEHFRIGHSKMKLAGDSRSSLQINPHITLHGIPPEAHAYVVNGRSPIEWFIDRYRITQDKHSGIVNDPNGWFGHPEDLIAAIRRVVHVSVETTRICAGLPDLFEDEYQSDVKRSNNSA